MSRAVIDQPGIRVVIIGLALAIFLGLALRSQISETRIQTYINRSIDRLETDFHVDYESAKVNLVRWGLPLPALVIQHIRMSPKSALCQSSQIYVEELEVPISIATILGFSKTIPKIRIKEIELRLSDIEKCIGQKKTVDIEESHETGSDSPEPKQDETHIKNIFINKSRTELREIYIEKLKIISNKKTAQPVLLKQLNLDLFYAQDRLSELHLKSKINALKDARSEVYFLNSDLIATFRSKNNNEIESILSINGKLLDGDVRFFAHSLSGSNKVSYELGIEHVSAKAFIPIIENFNSEKNINFERTPISVSFLNSGKFLMSDKTSLDSKFKNVQINIGSGLLKTNAIEFDYTDSKFSIKPFELTIQSLPLSVFKNVEPVKNKLDSFESLGSLSGRLEYKNENSYKINGDIKNIQAVFSNRGRRDLQNIEHVDIQISRTSDEVKLGASDFIINNEKVAGELKALYNVNRLNMVAEFKISGATLNNKIWEQFTFVEQSPKVEVLWNYKKIDYESHNIKIYVDKIALPGIRLTGLNVDINQVFSEELNRNSLSVAIKPTSLIGDQSFLQNNIVSQVLNSNYGFKLNTLNSNKTNLVLQGSDWKNINFNLDSYFLSDLAAKSDTHLAFNGSVKFHEGMAGKLLLQNRKTSFKFDLSRNINDEIIIKRAE